eukprot:GHVN01042797.1.p1 GENE.GHVN01042797.1~~GHVN01042797.1.p1  ORF type:complete len:102 (-),score=8.14 GHVN01042797.1:64-369(-)
MSMGSYEIHRTESDPPTPPRTPPHQLTPPGLGQIDRLPTIEVSHSPQIPFPAGVDRLESIDQPKFGDIEKVGTVPFNWYNWQNQNTDSKFLYPHRYVQPES